MSKRFGFSILVFALALMLSLAYPLGVARADDGTPPPPTDAPATTPEPTNPPAPAPVIAPTDAPTQAPVVVPTNAVTQAPVVVPTDVVTQAPVVVPTDVVTQAPVIVPTDALTQAPVVDQQAAVTATPEATATQSVPDIMASIPENTNLTVIGADGKPQSLTTPQSAQIILNGDPMWCPNGVLPGDSSCTSQFGSFTELITYLANNHTSGSGTIYVAYDYNANTAGESGTTFLFDQSQLSLNNLTIQGGWSFTSNNVVSTSTVSGSGIQIGTASSGWNGNVTLNDLIFSNSPSQGVVVYGNTNVTLSNITVTGANRRGVAGGNGVFVDTRGNISLDNVNVSYTSAPSGSYGRGAYLNGDGNVTVTNSSFNNNSGTGLKIRSGGTVTIANTITNQNGSSRLENFGKGLTVLAPTVNLSNITSSENVEEGVYISGFNTVNVDQATLDNNGTGGLNLLGGDSHVVTLNNVEASGNAAFGVYSTAIGTGSYSLNVNNSSLNNNGAGTIPPAWAGKPIGGLVADYSAYGSGTTITLDGLTANGNKNYGVYLLGGASQSVSNSTFIGNTSVGLYAQSQTVTLDQVTASNNGTSSSTPSTSNSDGSGVFVDASNGGTLNFVTTDGNKNAGLFLNSGSGGFVIKCATITNNSYGVVANTSGVLQLQSATFSNNPFGDTINPSGTTTQTTVECTPPTPTPPPPTPTPAPPSGGDTGSGTGTGTRTGSASGSVFTPSQFGASGVKSINLDGSTVELSCATGSTTIKLTDGSTVVFGCPTGDHGRVNLLEKDKIPGAVPDKLGYVDALQVDVLLGNTVLPPMRMDGWISVGFFIPENMKGKQFVVLFWDPAQNNGAGGWVELPPFAKATDGKEQTFSLRSPADALSILSGVNVTDRMVWVKTNFPGTFLLVTK